MKQLEKENKKKFEKEIIIFDIVKGLINHFHNTFANYVKLLYNIGMQTYFISQLAIFQKTTIIKEEIIMATQVSFKDVFSCDGSLCFRFDDGEAFSVKSLNNGIMVIDPICGCTIHSFAKNVAGCFEEGSNFNGLKAIEFEFNGAYVSVTAKNATPEKIVQLWNEKMEENRIKYEKEREST